jgi:hypothetical protein
VNAPHSEPIPGGAVGIVLDGYHVAVVNDHAVRLAAQFLFVVGVVGWTTALTTGDFGFARLFAIVFLIEMGLRIGLGVGSAPLYLVGNYLTRGKEPLWVGAPQKAFAWGIGFAFSVSACFAFGWLGLPAVALAICGVCLTILGAEAFFGWCMGCAIHRRLWPDKTFHCADGSCEVPAR